MTDKSADVFCLTNQEGKLLDPALQATVLAKYSRSPLSARHLLAELTEEEADKFQEKWVVGFGHNSVAELSNIPVCMEGISIVASKFVETSQRAGYSEKSTRYQEFSSDSFITPPGAPSTMKAFAKRFYDAYLELGDPVRKRCAVLMDMDPNDPATLQNRVLRARAFDNLRYLLPAGTGTNVAIVANMRDIRTMICSLRGHANSEFKVLGDKLHDAAQTLAPTLVKHTEPDEFQLPITSLGQLSIKFNSTSPSWYVDFHRPHLLPDPYLSAESFKSLIADRHGMSWSAFKSFMDKRPQHSGVPEVFKSIRMEFDIMMDYGAFRDLQRHRRCEQAVEPLTANYGYLVPDDIAGSDLEPAYRSAMESVHAYDDDRVIYNMDWMQYIIPLGYLHRSQFEMDMKQLYYIVELRTKPQGHISYRRIAYDMFELAKNKWPELMEWCRAINPVSIGAHT